MCSSDLDLRVQTVTVPAQHCITSDNVPVAIQPVIFLRVRDAERSVVAVANYVQATTELAVGTVRDVTGQITLQALLSEPDAVSAQLTAAVNAGAREWGVEVRRIAIKSVGLSADLRNALAQEAAAERQRRAMLIRAQGETDAAAELAEATRILAESDRGLAMRYLQVIQQVGDDGHPILFMPRGNTPHFDPDDVQLD